ncbi:MAG TPA: hypothetical protein VJP85_04020 [Candidatus Baltobacteraceae bacterium]|nr:hypothetical protein [Candidatus Baltobacteraceae bacterium]
MPQAGGLNEAGALLIAFGALAAAGLLFAAAYWGVRRSLLLLARFLLFFSPAALVMYLLARYSIPQVHLIGTPLLALGWALFVGTSVRSSTMKDHLVALSFGAVFVACFVALESLHLERLEWPAAIILFAALFIVTRYYRRSHASQLLKKT